MEMRKFNVEIRSDGSVYATEYEEPGERLFSVENEVSAERLDIRDALQKIDLECCTEVAAAWRNHEKICGRRTRQGRDVDRAGS